MVSQKNPGSINLKAWHRSSDSTHAKRCTVYIAIHTQHKKRREISGVGSENYTQFQLVFPQSKLELEGLDVVASLGNELVFTFWLK